jgi:Viral BACON domain
MIRRTIAVLAVACAFATRMPAQCPTTAATPQSPTGSIANANTSVTFTWTAPTASGINGYDVLVGQGTSSSRTVACTASSTATSCTVAAGFPAGGYNWLVRTKIAACPNLDSAIKSFTVACSTTAPVNQSPADTASNVSQTPTLQWTAVPGASGYEVFFGVTGTAGAACSGQPITTVNTNSATAPQLQAGTSYEWKVESIFANGCPGTISACTKFTTAPASCAPAGAFSLVSPANAALVTTDKPTLQWNASSGASKYFVHIGLANPPVPQANDPQVTATSYTIGTSLSPATYYWYVDAFPSCGTAGKTSSAVSHFTVSTCPTAATTLISPGNGSTNVASPVTFSWSPVSGAAGYNLYIADELVTTTSAVQATVPLASGSSLTWYVDTLYKNCNAVRSAPASFQTANPAACPTGSITPSAPASGATLSGDSQVTFAWTSVNASAYRLFVSVDGGPYAQFARTSNPTASVPVPSGNISWYVEALFNSITITNCPSIVSPLSKFTVTPSAGCGTHKQVTLASPIAGSAASPVTFTWTATDPFVTLYRVWISVNGAPFDDIGVTTNTQLKSSVDAGTVVWYVQSFFQGCPTVSSATATFTATSTTPRCPTAFPTTLAPINNLAVLSPVTFTWTPVTGVDNYRLFVSKDGGEFLSLDDNLDGTTATHDLPPGTYLWYVESTFDECPSTRSARAKFTVNLASNCPADGAALLSPPDAPPTVANPVTFDWNDVANATSYALIARHDDGSPTRLALTTVSNATRHLAPGSYEWWVVAFLPGCPSTESAHRTFVIPPNTCDIHGPLLLHLPPDGISLVSPVRFTWSNVRNATQYKVWVSVDGGPFSVIGRPTSNALTATVPAGAVSWYVEAVPSLSSCTSVLSTQNSFTSLAAQPACDKPARPQATVIGQVASGTPYSVRWAAILNTDHYEVQESITADFNNAPTQSVSDTSADFNHTATSAPVHYYYRVRAISSCDDEHSLYSKVVSVFVVPAQKQTSVEYGISTATTQTVKLPGQTPATTFSVTADKPWITVTPSSGQIGPAGVTLTVTSDPGSLDLGTNTATLIVTYGTSGKTAPNAVSSGSVPVSINLVTPVAPNGKNTPLPTSLIIPAVAHAQGANNSLFQSDVRIANVSATAQKYLLNFTVTGTDGTQSGQSTTIQIDPGTQMSLNDLLTTFFGAGNDGNGSAGVLEIRPLTNNSPNSSFSSSSTVSVQTVASSKTYDVTSNGTFGQFIPAIPFSQFISNTGSGAAQSFISLQQIAQSDAFRTNLGILEAAGEPANVLIHVYDNSGNQLAQIPLSLLPGEHTQINSFLAVNNLNVTDGRIEVEVTSTTGKVSAYASVVDNQTNDPLLVFPVLKGAATATRYTIPGVADLNNGFASWRSDIRVYNPTATAANATLTYYPQGDATVPPPQTVTINPGQVYAIDNALQTLYGLTNSGGAIVVSTPSTSALTVTARTYNQTGAGTYGQFIPAVSPAQSVGLGDRTLQVLQLESSSAYRTNIGIAETSGNPVTVQVTLVPEDSKVSANLTYNLNPNEFRQFSIGDFNFGTMYNARVSVKVIGGTGRVTAYGSVIDQITQDPTYVPAQ